MTVSVDLGEVTTVLGRKHSGKSVLIERLLCDMRRFVVLDPNGEHGPPGSVAVGSPEELIERWIDGDHRLIVRDPPLKQAKAESYIRTFAQLSGAYLVIDESHNYLSAHSVPDCLKAVAKWHLTHNRCGLILGAHQAKEIHDSIWTHTDNYLIFSYGDHRDAKLERATIPGKEEVLASLDPDSYQFLAYQDAAGERATVEGPVEVPDHLNRE